MAQLLTPAPDTGAVTWKRATFEAGQHRFTDTKPERIERAIANDEAWLAAHPTKRTGNVEACAKRRAFKEAMRQRIREIAASLNLSDIQIKLALRLKHEEVGRFCQTHSVNPGWLLEGAAPMFKGRRSYTLTPRSDGTVAQLTADDLLPEAWDLPE